METRTPLTFALGWVVANQIVRNRYRRSGIDALPVYHPENGWDRFLLTRRVTGKQFANEPANSCGMIMLDGEDAPRLTRPNGTTILSLGRALRADPESTVDELLKHIKRPQLPDDVLDPRWKDRRKQYHRLYEAITELILEYPGAIAAREVFVDNLVVDGAYHPLYLHGVVSEPRLVYDWIMIQHGRWAVFIRTHADHAIYETDRRTWSTIKNRLADEDDIAGMKRRIAGWLRLTGEPLDQLDPRLSPRSRSRKPSSSM